ANRQRPISRIVSNIGVRAALLAWGTWLQFAKPFAVAVLIPLAEKSGTQAVPRNSHRPPSNRTAAVRTMSNSPAGSRHRRPAALIHSGTVAPSGPGRWGSF